jgi:hypothetical protein
MRVCRLFFFCAALCNAACVAGVTDDEADPSGLAARACSSRDGELTEQAASSSLDEGGPMPDAGFPLRSNPETAGRVKATMY